MDALKKVVIVGAGGLGREVLATVRACNETGEGWQIVGFLDSNPSVAGDRIAGLPVLGNDDWCKDNNDGSLGFVCAIGSPKIRCGVVGKLSGMNCKFISVIHPGVTIPDSVRVGVGTVIMAGTRFTTDAYIGSHVVIYLNCSITHDVRVSDFCQIAPGCNLSGACVLESGVELGTGVSVLPGRRVGEWAMIGAGGIVTHDIPSYTTAVGVPCRAIKTHGHSR